jgi:hypothetical protein
VPRTFPRFALPRLFAAALLAAALPAMGQSYLPKSQTIGGNPGPAYNYVCPNIDATAVALDCFYDAVRHLYTMCRHVKSIEIIEHGYEKSTEGVNGAKSESCVDKQKANMTRPYQAALREATVSKQAVDMVRGLHEYWLDSLLQLKWQPGESDEEYKSRTTKVYEVIDERVGGIKLILTTVRARASEPASAETKPRAVGAPRPKADR